MSFLSSVARNISRRLKIGQFNILADAFADPSHYPTVRKDFLAWNYRKNVLLDQIGTIGADIVCLEELDHYQDFFRDAMGAMGYASCYVQRPLRPTSRGRREDGCGIFYKKDLLNLISQKSHTYCDNHDRVALGCMFEFVDDPEMKLLVSNTHLYWDNRKLMDQMHELLELEGFLTNLLNDAAGKWGVRPNSIPVLLAGDFNIFPASQLYRKITSDFLNSCGIHMRSSFENYCPGGGEPVYTTFKINYKHCLDFIFYSESTVEVLELQSIPTKEEIERLDGPGSALREAGIPNRIYGSDHLPIAAILEIHKAHPH